MGVIHVTSADQTVWISGIISLAGAIAFLWKRQNEKDEANKIEIRELASEVRKELKESNEKCQAENVLLRADLFSLKEELGFLKGFLKSFNNETKKGENKNGKNHYIDPRNK